MWPFRKKHIFSVWYIVQDPLGVNTKRHTWIKGRDIVDVVKQLRQIEHWPISITDFEICD